MKKEVIKKNDIVRVKNWGNSYTTCTKLIEAMYRLRIISMEQAVRYDYGNSENYYKRCTTDNRHFIVLARFVDSEYDVCYITEHGNILASSSCFIVDTEALELTASIISIEEAEEKLMELTGKNYSIKED